MARTKQTLSKTQVAGLKKKSGATNIQESVSRNVATKAGNDAKMAKVRAVAKAKRNNRTSQAMLEKAGMRATNKAIATRDFGKTQPNTIKRRRVATGTYAPKRASKATKDTEDAFLMGVLADDRKPKRKVPKQMPFPGMTTKSTGRGKGKSKVAKPNHSKDNFPGRRLKSGAPDMRDATNKAYAKANNLTYGKQLCSK